MTIIVIIASIIFIVGLFMLVYLSGYDSGVDASRRELDVRIAEIVDDDYRCRVIETFKRV